MIDVSSLTQMAQSQTVVPETARTVQPVQPVAASHGGNSADNQSRDLPYSQPDKVHKHDDKLQGLNQVVAKDSSLQFRVDQESNELVVSLMDSNGELIRQMPSELIMRLARRIEEIQTQGQFGFEQIA